MNKVGKNTPAKGNCTLQNHGSKHGVGLGSQKQDFIVGLWCNQRNALTKAIALE